MSNQPTVAERTALAIRQQSRRLGATQADLAEVLNLTQSAVSHRFNGRTPFQLHEVELLAAFLDVPLYDLVPIEDVTP